MLRARAVRRLVFDNFTIEPDYQVRQYFPLKEWFYIQEYMDSVGRLKAWYCNIGTPAEFNDSTITTRDLILDLFVQSNGKIEILDEDELRAKQELIPTSTLEKIDEAKRRLLEMVEKRISPFDKITRLPSATTGQELLP